MWSRTTEDSGERRVFGAVGCSAVGQLPLADIVSVLVGVDCRHQPVQTDISSYFDSEQELPVVARSHPNLLPSTRLAHHLPAEDPRDQLRNNGCVAGTVANEEEGDHARFATRPSSPWLNHTSPRR